MPPKRNSCYVRTYDRSVLLHDGPVDEPLHGPWPEDEDEYTDLISVVTYTTAGGQEREAQFIQNNKMAWEDATEYRGRRVLMEIIRRMHQVSGMAVDEWEQRGVEVDDRVWKVLEDWMIQNNIS